MAPTTDRKRASLSIAIKCKILREVELGLKSKTEIAKEYGILKNTLSTFIKAKDKILRCENAGTAPGRIRSREAKYPELETALVLWLKNLRAKNIPIDGSILKEQAETFALRMKISTFKASDGWLQKFKLRHGLTFRKVCGESASVDINATKEWKEERLKSLLAQHSPGDIFNADETGLIYKLLPDRTFVFKGETCNGGKHAKERITVMMASNMTGTEKLPLLIIGKAKKPRCFKNIPSLPVTYRANKKAWMTSDLYEEWLRDLDRKFVQRGRKILFVVDNCTAHPRIEGLQAITVEYLPPNVTSVLQPMDQGIIQCFKKKYRRAMLKRIILNLEHGKEYFIDLLGAIHIAVWAWNEVSEQTIKNCFSHAGFQLSVLDPADAVTGEDDESEDDALLEILRQKKVPVPEDMTFLDFSNVDKDLQCTEEVSDDDIIAKAMEVNSPESEEESDDEPESVPRPSCKDAVAAVALLRSFFKFDDESVSLLKNVSVLEDRIYSSMKVKQSKITGYFQKPSK